MLNDLEENKLTTDTFLFLHMKIMTMFTEKCDANLKSANANASFPP